MKSANIPNKLYVLRAGCDVVGQLEIGIYLYFYRNYMFENKVELRLSSGCPKKGGIRKLGSK